MQLDGRPIAVICSDMRTALILYCVYVQIVCNGWPRSIVGPTANGERYTSFTMCMQGDCCLSVATAKKHNKSTAFIVYLQCLLMHTLSAANASHPGMRGTLLGKAGVSSRMLCWCCDSPPSDFLFTKGHVVTGDCRSGPSHDGLTAIDARSCNLYNIPADCALRMLCQSACSFRHHAERFHQHRQPQTASPAVHACKQSMHNSLCTGPESHHCCYACNGRTALVISSVQ